MILKLSFPLSLLYLIFTRPVHNSIKPLVDIIICLQFSEQLHLWLSCLTVLFFCKRRWWESETCSEMYSWMKTI